VKTVIKTDTLPEIFKHCVEQGLIVSSQACLTPTEQEVPAYWQCQIEHYIHHWYSLQNHVHILKVLLELKTLGQNNIAWVGLKGIYNKGSNN
jgi:hypothetical protein